MGEVVDFGLVVLIVAGGFSAAVGLSKLTERFPVPGPALFLLVAAIASDVFPGLSVLDTKTVGRIGVVALIVILFDGGMHVGWRRFAPLPSRSPCSASSARSPLPGSWRCSRTPSSTSAGRPPGSSARPWRRRIRR